MRRHNAIQSGAFGCHQSGFHTTVGSPSGTSGHRETVSERVEWYPSGQLAAATRTHQTEWVGGGLRRRSGATGAWLERVAAWIADVVGLSLVVAWVAAAVWAGLRLGGLGGALVMIAIVAIILASGSPKSS